MNVLFVVSEKYPDMDTAYGRLSAGLATEHQTWRLKSGHAVRKMAVEIIGEDIPVFEGEYEFKDEALWEEALHTMDYVIVFSDSAGGIAGFMKRKTTKFPYNRIFGHKAEVNVTKESA